MQDVSLIVIKAKRLNSNSNYSITVSLQSSSNISTFPLIAFLLLLIFALVGILGWAGWFIIILVHWLHKNRVVHNGIHEQNKRNEDIKNALSSMKSGKLGEFRIRFEETKCVICLEIFDSSSDIHIINECSHYFHSDWLHSWFKNIRLNLKLKWPLCLQTISHRLKFTRHSDISIYSQNRAILNEYTSQMELQ